MIDFVVLKHISYISIFSCNKMFLEPNWFKGFSDKTKIFTQSIGLLFHSESYYVEENSYPIIAAHIRIEVGLMGSYSIPLF